MTFPFSTPAAADGPSGHEAIRQRMLTPCRDRRQRSGLAGNTCGPAELAGHPAAQPGDCGRMKLRDARLVDAKPQPYLLHRQSAVIVEGHDQTFALREAGERAGNEVSLFPPVTENKRVAVSRRRQIFFIHALTR